MSEAFEKAHAFTAKWEGGHCDVKEDKGGYTAYGASTMFVQSITETRDGCDFLVSLGLNIPITQTEMRKITKDMAKSMFKREFWDALHLDDFDDMLAAAIYDMAVNHGKAGATKIIQRAHNDLCGTQLKVDGAMGPLTRAAIKSDPLSHLLNKIVTERKLYYHSIVDNNPSQSKFLTGWVNRSNDQAKFLGVA